jgi:LysM repeat protein
MASLILPPGLPVAKAAPVRPAQKAQGQIQTRRMLLVGDSLSIGLGQQLEMVLAGQPGVRFSHLGKVSSGLANPAFFDWNVHLTELVAAQHPDTVLIMVGANDDKPLPGPDGKSLPFGVKAWDAAYAARLAKLHAIIRAGNADASVFYLGVPIMADPAFDKKMIHISALIADTAEKLPGASYIDVRGVLADASGAFAPMARTADGDVTKLRAGDGVHISGIGSRLLAARCLESLSAAAGLPRQQLVASIADRDARPVSGTTLAASPAPVRVAMAVKPQSPKAPVITPAPAAPAPAAAPVRVAMATKPEAPKASVVTPAPAAPAPAVAPVRVAMAEAPKVPAVKAATPAVAPAAYTVADGDTLWSVARRLGVSADALAKANPGVDPRRMSIGQSLALPADARPAVVTAAASLTAAPAARTPAAAASEHDHVVAEGDNYWSVARRYDVSVAALTAANPGVDPTRLRIGQKLVIPDTAAAASVQVADGGRYVVSDGDNFWIIAHRLGLDVAELTRANAAVDPYKLQPGQVLSLPGMARAEGGQPAPARESRVVGENALYPVAKGDTMWALARRFGVDLETLLTRNGEVDPVRLQVGQLVTIPGASPVASAETLAFPVSEGDTLGGIARRFDVSVEDLLAANPGVDPLRLQVGQILRVPSSLAAVAASGAQQPVKAPAPVVNPAEAAPAVGRSLRDHTVSLGDTIWDISRRYGVSVERILSENSGIDPLRLQVGQTVHLPDSVVAMATR